MSYEPAARHGRRSWLTTGRSPKPRILNAAALNTLATLLEQHGLSAAEVERGLDYVAENEASTLKQGFTLALSRVTLSDAELAAGLRFSFSETGAEVIQASRLPAALGI